VGIYLFFTEAARVDNTIGFRPLPSLSTPVTLVTADTAISVAEAVDESEEQAMKPRTTSPQIVEIFRRKGLAQMLPDLHGVNITLLYYQFYP
jgi:hypothetical protein